LEEKKGSQKGGAAGGEVGQEKDLFGAKQIDGQKVEQNPSLGEELDCFSNVGSGDIIAARAAQQKWARKREGGRPLKHRSSA